MIGLESSGSFDNLEKFLLRMSAKNWYAKLDQYGQQGVEALSAATPSDKGVTKLHWKYRIVTTRTGKSIEWYNDNVENDQQIAILIQYGHGTRQGGYVEGRDFINPALKPLFDTISQDIERQVKE